MACTDYTVDDLEAMAKYLCYRCADVPPQGSSRRAAAREYSSPSPGPSSLSSTGSRRAAASNGQQQGRSARRRQQPAQTPYNSSGKQSDRSSSPPPVRSSRRKLDSVDDMKNVLKKYVAYLRANSLIAPSSAALGKRMSTSSLSSSSSSSSSDESASAKTTDAAVDTVDVVSMDVSPTMLDDLAVSPTTQTTVQQCTRAFLDSVQAFEERFGKDKQHMDIARLPPEVTTQIVARGGVRTCAILRHRYALHVILRAYDQLHDRYAPEDKAALEHCLKHKWSAGVRMLIEHCNYQIAIRGESVQRLNGIILTPPIIQWLWRQPHVASDKHAACLVYNLAAAGWDVDDLVRWFCHVRPRTCLLAYGEELMRRGGTIHDLRRLCEMAGSERSEHAMARLFVGAAARCHRVDLLKEFGPDALLEHPTLILEAAASGGLETVQFLQQQQQQTAGAGRHRVAQAVDKAIDDNAFDVACWLESGDVADFSNIWPPDAACHGRVDIVEWHMSRGVESPLVYTDIALQAAEHGQLPILCLIQDKLLPTTDHSQQDLVSRCLQLASKGGHLATVQWLSQYSPMQDASQDVLSALTGGHVEIAQWLLDHGQCQLDSVQVSAEQLQQIVRSGRLEALQFLDRHFKVEYTSSLILEALATQNLAVVQHVFCAVPNATMAANLLSFAARSESLALVQWVFSRADESQQAASQAIDIAAEWGTLETVRWLCENTRSTCSEYAMGRAIVRDRLDIVQYLYQHRSEGWPPSVINSAAAGGHLRTVVWLHENRAEGCTTDAIDQAAAAGHLSVVRWLYENRSEGCTGSAMYNASVGGWLDIVRLLHQHRAQRCNAIGLVNAAANGFLDMVQWYHQHIPEHFTSEVAKEAAFGGYLSILKFLHQHGYPMCRLTEIQYQAPAYVKDWVAQHAES
ncbi:hypothetical protein RI367_004523 [Sorochytrium milnesiophthora]